MNHPFIDGNKRTRYILMEAVLRHEGYRITATNVEVYDFVISISKAEKTFETIEQWLKENV